MIGTLLGTSISDYGVKLKHPFKDQVKDQADRYNSQKQWPQDLLPAMRVAGRGTDEKRLHQISRLGNTVYSDRSGRPFRWAEQMVERLRRW